MNHRMFTEEVYEYKDTAQIISYCNILKLDSNQIILVYFVADIFDLESSKGLFINKSNTEYSLDHLNAL